MKNLSLALLYIFVMSFLRKVRFVHRVRCKVNIGLFYLGIHRTFGATLLKFHTYIFREAAKKRGWITKAKITLKKYIYIYTFF